MLGLFSLSNLDKLGSQNRGTWQKWLSIYLSIYLPTYLSHNIPQTPSVQEAVETQNCWIVHIMECLRRRLESWSLSHIWRDSAQQKSLLIIWPGLWNCKTITQDIIASQSNVYQKTVFLSWSTVTDWIGGSLRVHGSVLYSGKDGPIPSELGLLLQDESINDTISLLEVLVLLVYFRKALLNFQILERIQEAYRFFWVCKMPALR
jgi:hypothetical protein